MKTQNSTLKTQHLKLSLKLQLFLPESAQEIGGILVPVQKEFAGVNQRHQFFVQRIDDGGVQAGGCGGKMPSCRTFDGRRCSIIRRSAASPASNARTRSERWRANVSCSAAVATSTFPMASTANSVTPLLSLAPARPRGTGRSALPLSVPAPQPRRSSGLAPRRTGRSPQPRIVPRPD